MNDATPETKIKTLIETARGHGLLSKI